MTKQITILTLLVAVLVFPLTVQAQDATTPTQEEVEQQKEALKNKAYLLLDRIIDESQSLRLPENRVRIQINSADLLWDRDQGRARSLFMQASDGVTELMRSSAPTSTNQRGPQPERRWFSLRQELVLAAARHDAPLAYQVLAATKQQITPATSPDGRNPRMFNPDDNLEQTLLGRIAALDPRLAAQNADQLMEKGQFPRTMGEVINQLQRQDAEAAAKLADKTVKRIQSANLLSNLEAGNLAQSLLSPGPRVSGTSQTDSKTQVTQIRGPVLEQSAYVELLSTVIDSALKATPQQQQNNQRAGARGGAGVARVVAPQNNQSSDVQSEQSNARRLLAGLQVVLPSIDMYLPARANSVRQKLTELGITDSTRVNFGQAMGALQQQGTPSSDSLMQVAATAPGGMQSRLYQQAAVRALEEGNTDRARQIANDFLQAGPRASVMQRIDFREMAKKGEGAKLDEIRQSLARLSSDSEKVGLLLQIAGDLQKDNPKAQLQLLEEAKQIVNHRANNYDQFEDQLRVARAFGAVDPARSFEVLEPGIAQLNELLSAASVLSGFEVSVFRDGEMVMTGQGGSNLNSTINRFGQELALLAKTDFERSETLAGRFQFTEPRIMTRMSIVQGALGSQTSTSPIPPNMFRNISGGGGGGAGIRP